MRLVECQVEDFPGRQPSNCTEIRYHDHEWDEVVTQAQARGLTPAAFVRKVSLGVDGNEDEVVLALDRIAAALAETPALR